MNRFIFGRGWVLQAPEGEDTTTGGGGAADTTVVEEEVVQGEGGEKTKVEEADPATVDEKKLEAPKDMKTAIDAALGYKKGPNGEALDPLTGKVKEAPAPKDGEKKPVAGAEEKHANGTPKKNEKGEPLDDKGQVVKQAAPKVKTAAELDLKPEERKALGTKANIRFGEIINTLKAHEGTIGKQTETIKTLSEARDTILGVLEETNTTQEQLAGYLEFNALLQSKDPKDLEQALSFVEDQRTALYKALGREPQGGGLDLLTDFPDLKKQVDDEEITRAAALEIAKGRRDKASRDADAQRQQQSKRSTETQAAAQKKEGAAALAEINAWTAGLAKTDLDYKAKEDKLLGETLEGVLKEYPPKLWLPTLKMLYAGIVIEKAPAPAGGHKPIRPSGAKPGAKAPNSMLDAINQGLGYAGAEKG